MGWMFGAPENRRWELYLTKKWLAVPQQFGVLNKNSIKARSIGSTEKRLDSPSFNRQESHLYADFTRWLSIFCRDAAKIVWGSYSSGDA